MTPVSDSASARAWSTAPRRARRTEPEQRIDGSTCFCQATSRRVLAVMVSRMSISLSCLSPRISGTPPRLFRRGAIRAPRRGTRRPPFGTDHPDGESGVGQHAVAPGGRRGVVQHGVEDARGLLGVSPPESSSGRQRPKPICSGVKTCSAFSGVATLNSEVSEISS